MKPAPIISARSSLGLATGLAALLMFGVLAFGAVEYWSLFTLRCGAALLLTLWAAGTARNGMRVATTPLFIPMSLWALLICAQYVSGRTAYRYATFDEGMNYVAYAICLFLAVQCFQREAMRKMLAAAISGFGAGVACFAMIQEFTSGGRLYWMRVPRHGGSIYGPYVNHNHYAGLMEMLAPIPLVLCLSNSVPGGKRLLYGAAALAMSTSLFLSGSRGGAVGFLAELLMLAVIFGIRERRNPRRTWRQLVILCGLLAALLFSLGNERMWTGLADLARGYNNEVAGGRWAIDRDALRMWAQKPLLGWGLGTFPTVFPQFRSFHSDLVTNQAHNDLLQIGVETGILGFAIMLVFVLLLWRSGLRRSSLHLSFSSAVTLGALISCTGLLVHSLTDFNLHVPANAAWFFFLCGIAGADRGTEHPRKSPDSEVPRPG